MMGEIWGPSPNEFLHVHGIVVDSKGNVYVTYEELCSVKKFTNNGTFVTSWRTPEKVQINSSKIEKINIDSNDNVYVVDHDNRKIMKFTNNSTSIMKWDSFGNGSREFRHHAITIDSKDNVYVDYEDNEDIQKFTNNGTFIDRWGYQGKQNPQYGFNEPHDLAVDSKDNVYLIDTQNHLVQKSDSNGNYISSWKKLGVKEGEFLLVSVIYIDSNDFIYVSDSRAVHPNEIQFQSFLLA